MRNAAVTAYRALAHALISIARVVKNILRELADENAYARHLTRSGNPPSGSEWRRFSDRRLRTKYSQGKCC